MSTRGLPVLPERLPAEPHLTPGEMRLLAALAQGEGHADVAANLGISPNTVKNTLNHVYAKLGTGGLIRTYRELGWLRVPAGKGHLAP